MSLTKFTESTNIISELDDQPSLTATELKAKFDEVGGKIKTYLNNTLTTETEQLVATEKTALQNSISSLSTSTIASINELGTTIDELRTAENAMIGDSYSTAQSYKIGDLCIYNNVLYRCTTAIDEGEAWNNSHWEQTTIEANLNLLKETVLYEDSTGTKSSVTLSDSVTNYNYIEIFYKSVDGYDSIKIHDANNKSVVLNQTVYKSSSVYFYFKNISIANSAISITLRKTFRISDSTTWSPHGDATDNISIMKVIGYK